MVIATIARPIGGEVQLICVTIDNSQRSQQPLCIALIGTNTNGCLGSYELFEGLSFTLASLNG